LRRAHEGQGISRALRDRARKALRDAGHRVAGSSVEPGTRDEPHYRAADRTVAARNAKGELVFQKPL
jgi:hypothetical protein